VVDLRPSFGSATAGDSPFGRIDYVGLRGVCKNIDVVPGDACQSCPTPAGGDYRVVLLAKPWVSARKPPMGR
jgi:hypothetical protein